MANVNRDPVRHIINSFNGLNLTDKLRIAAQARAARYVEQAHFSLKLIRNGAESTSVFSGLYSGGRPSQTIAGWIDGDYYDNVSFPDSSTIQLSDSLLGVKLFKIIGAIIPDGGSLMVSYSLFTNESTIHKETKLSLDRGYPPVTSPLGYLLSMAGCGSGFKDWYFAEGRREGPEKLQGYKAANSDIARQQTERMLSVLERFIQITDKDTLAHACRMRARTIIRSLSYPNS